MSEDHEERAEHLSDREILLLVRSDVKTLISSRDDHESRLKGLERFGAIASGAVGIASLVVGWMKIKVSVH